MPVERGEHVSRRGAAAAVRAAAKPSPKPAPVHHSRVLPAATYSDPIATLPIKHPTPLAHDVFVQRRTRLFRHVDKEVNAGRMTPLQGHHALQTAGFIPGGSGFKPATGVGGFVARGVADIASNAVYTPAGIYQAGKAAGLDVRDTAHGHPTLKRTGQAGKAVVTGMKQDIRHPLRHPGNVALDLFGLLSLGAGAGVRGVSAAGELGAEGSALSRAGAAGKALARKPAPLRRTLRVNDLEVHPPASTNPLMRGMQELHDRAISQGRRVPALRPTAEKRAGFELKQEGRVLDAVANAPAAALHKAGSKGRVTNTAAWRAQQMALRVKAEGRTTAERIAFEQQRINELGSSPSALMEKRRHAANIRDLTAARAHLDERTGVPVIKDRHLKALYDQTSKVAKGRDQLLESIGLLTPDQLAARPHMPGRVIGGAEFEKPTPAKLGKSPALDRARADERRLQRRFDQAYEKQRGRLVTTTKPRSVAEAKQELARLDMEHQRALDRMASEMFGPIDMGEVRFRNAQNARAGRQAAGVDRSGRRSGASGAKAQVRPTVKQERRDAAEAAIVKAIARNPDHPVMRRWAQRMETIDQLRGALSPELFGKVDPRALGRSEVQRYVRRNAKLERVGGALSIAKDRSERLQAAAENRIKPTGMIGQEDFTGGEFRVPSTAKRPAKGGGTGAGSGGTVSYPKAPGSVTHGYTGALLKHGLERNDVARLVAESAMEGNKYRAVMRLRDRIVKASVDTPPNLDDYLPVRLDNLKSGKLPQLVKDAQTLPEGPARSALEQSQNTTRMQHFWETVFPKHPSQLTPEAQQAFQKLAEEGKIGWVHKDLIRQVRHPSLLAPARAYVAEGPTALRAAAGVGPAINRASKAAILYLKPAYAAPNILGNAALGLVQQGWAAPKNLSRSARLNATIGPEALQALDGAVGEGIAASLHDAGSNLAARTVNKAADVWSKGVDTPFRRATFLHEANRYGYRTPERLHALLTDPAHEGDLVQVAQRANRALIDYGRLGPLEQEIVRHLVFFYPWIKGSTMYAGHFVTEHPAQAAVVNQLGEQGKQRARRELGAGPSYLEGLFKVGGTDQVPTVVNPSGAAILTTPADVAQGGLAVFSGSPGEAMKRALSLTPAVSAGLSAFYTRRDPLTDQQLTGRPITDFGKQLTKGLPQVSLYNKLSGADKRDPKDVLFPPSPQLAAKQFALGSAVPKPMNRSKFLSLGEKERRGTLDRVERARFDGQKNAVAYQQAAFRAGLIKPGGKLPATLSNVLHLHTLRAANLAIWQDKIGHKLTETDRFTADVRQLQSWKKISPAKAEQAIAWAQTALPNDVEKQRRYIGEQFYGSKVLSAARKQILTADPRAVLP